MAEVKGPSIRIQRVEKEIREIVSQFVVTEVPEFETIVSVSRVIVSRDLRKAKVLIHALEGIEDTRKAVKILKSYAPAIQKIIANQIRMRYCPRIELYADENYEEVMRVHSLIEELQREREQGMQS